MATVTTRIAFAENLYSGSRLAKVSWDHPRMHAGAAVAATIREIPDAIVVSVGHYYGHLPGGLSYS